MLNRKHQAEVATTLFEARVAFGRDVCSYEPPIVVRQQAR